MHETLSIGVHSRLGKLSEYFTSVCEICVEMTALLVPIGTTPGSSSLARPVCEKQLHFSASRAHYLFLVELLFYSWGTIRRHRMAEARRRVIAAIPAFNAAKTIAEVIVLTNQYVDRIVVCDDGSTDLTRAIAKRLGADIVDHGRRLGKGASLRSLFQYATNAEADVVVTLDADGQHNPEDIPKLVGALESTGADVVNGSRFLGHSAPNQKRSQLAARVLNSAAGADVTDASSGFRAYSRRAANLLVPSEIGTSADSEILMKAREGGLRIVEVPISIEYFEPRALDRGTLLPSSDAFFGILKRHSIQHPLIIYGVTGFVIFMAGLLIMTYATARWLLTLQPSPNLLVGGVALLIVGMVTGSTGLILWVMISVVRDR